MTTHNLELRALAHEIIDSARAMRRVTKAIAEKVGVDPDEGLSDEMRLILDGASAEEDFTPVNTAPKEVPDTPKDGEVKLLYRIMNPDYPAQRLHVSHLVQRLQVILDRQGDMPIATYDMDDDGEVTSEWAYDVEVFEGKVVIS